nr:EOG090X0C5G [Sida crystallina]
MEDHTDISDHRVTSEVHVFSETEESGELEKTVISKFKFNLPDQLVLGFSNASLKSKTDKDGDLDVTRKNQAEDHVLAIKHHVRTSLDLVGLQVWRGALLLADYLLYAATDAVPPEEKITAESRIVELGAGTGLTSVVAAMVAGKVTSTDIDLGSILALIETNCQLNKQYIFGDVSVLELDFNKHYYTEELQSQIENADLVIAADVVYHDDLTDAFLKSLKKLMATGKEKTALIALEKRYVFTISELDSVAPCFDYFHEKLLQVMAGYRIEAVDTGRIAQYFCYEKVKELVLFRISSQRR